MQDLFCRVIELATKGIAEKDEAALKCMLEANEYAANLKTLDECCLKLALEAKTERENAARLSATCDDMGETMLKMRKQHDDSVAALRADVECLAAVVTERENTVADQLRKLGENAATIAVLRTALDSSNASILNLQKQIANADYVVVGSFRVRNLNFERFGLDATVAKMVTVPDSTNQIRSGDITCYLTNTDGGQYIDCIEIGNKKIHLDADGKFKIGYVRPAEGITMNLSDDKTVDESTLIYTCGGDSGVITMQYTSKKAYDDGSIRYIFSSNGSIRACFMVNAAGKWSRKYLCKITETNGVPAYHYE